MRNMKILSLGIAVILLSACSLFQTKPTDINFQTVYNYALYSQMAYEEPGPLTSWAEEQQHTLVHTNKPTADEVQYFLLRPKGKDYDVIAIRGTASLEDALVDMKFKLKPMDSFGVPMHTGFAEAAEKILADVKPFLSKARPVHTTGHSLGGAAAVALGMLLKNEGYQLDAIYTYGQPKVTDWTGREKYKSLPLTRIATKHDVVPLVPPVSLDIKDERGLYWHIGGETVIYEGNTYSQLGFAESTARQVIDFIPNTLTERQLSAHFMDTYMAYLKPKLEGKELVEYKF